MTSDETMYIAAMRSKMVKIIAPLKSWWAEYLGGGPAPRGAPTAAHAVQKGTWPA
jgi:hypothetical protein